MFKKQNLILITNHYQTSCQAGFSAIFSVLTVRKMAACHTVTDQDGGSFRAPRQNRYLLQQEMQQIATGMHLNIRAGSAHSENALTYNIAENPAFTFL
jgi:hypothetical protein